MFIDKDDRVISAELILSRKWEEYERQLFAHSINPGDTVIDIGAHIGTFTLVAAQKAGPNGKVYAFEPLAKNFLLLKKNIYINGYKNVVVVNKAVTDKVGTGKLFLTNEDNFGDQRMYDSGESRVSMSVKTTSLDAFFKNRDQVVNVIKMDIQGSEVLALKGAAHLLNNSKQLKLFTEFWPKALRQAGSTATEHLNLLKKHGFSLYEIDSQNEKKMKVTAQRLFTAYPEDSIINADLFCIKG